jgi:predicted metal-binding membrane protein
LPVEFLSRHWRPGASGAFRMGVEHGLYCVGCCWMLMALLFVGGLMNLVWIALLSLFVLAEKLLPAGAAIGRIAGVLLVVWGIATLTV